MRDPVFFEVPFIAGTGIGVVQATVLLQVFGRLWRAMALQVGGGGANQQLLRGQGACHQPESFSQEWSATYKNFEKFLSAGIPLTP